MINYFFKYFDECNIILKVGFIIISIFNDIVFFESLAYRIHVQMRNICPVLDYIKISKR